MKRSESNEASVPTEVPASPPTPKNRRGLTIVVAAIALVIVLIGAAIALTSPTSNQPRTLPDCRSPSNCLYPSSVALLSGPAGLCNGAGTGNTCPAQSSGGFGCEVPKDTSGCHLTSNYTFFRITWSASGLLGVGVGSNGNDCKWFDGGYCTWTKATGFGDRWITANWGLDGRVWFEVVNRGTTDVTISNLTITAIKGALKPVVTFSGVTKINAVTYTFTVASAQPSVDVSNYKINFGIGMNTGTAVNMGQGNVNTTVNVTGATPASVGVKWTDLGGTGQVKGGDILTVAFPSPAATGIALTFYLLYSDGSQIQSKVWQG